MFRNGAFSYRLLLTAAYLMFSFVSLAQNETKKWLFGFGAGLDFMSSPPANITGILGDRFTCASIADGAGNLLFYSNGITVWNSLNFVMANGNTITPVPGVELQTLQGCFIVKKPGSSTLYYIITQTHSGFNTSGSFTFLNNIFYSIVDMSLAAGQGSVTQKGVVLDFGPQSGKLAATTHCNGTDIWLVAKEWFNPLPSTSGTVTLNFRAYLLSSTGINTTAIISPASPIVYTVVPNIAYHDWGSIKISPNGKKLGIASYNLGNQWLGTNNPLFELYDFNNSTGSVSNQRTLVSGFQTGGFAGGLGCEFSPDGTKFYGSRMNGASSDLYQWDLCAGTTATAIAASCFTIFSPGFVGPLQLASNGKIYCSRGNNILGQPMAIIDNPNAGGIACNYISSALSVSPANTTWALPNFISNLFYQRPPAIPFSVSFSTTANCLTGSFLSSYIPGATVTACPGAGIFTVTAVSWNFGDPITGAANTSTLVTPFHVFSSPGTYTSQLIVNYSCGGGTDTIRQPVVVNAPVVGFNTSSVTCASLGSATVNSTGGLGPYSYTWMPGSTTGTSAAGQTPGTKTITVFDAGLNCFVSNTVYFAPLVPLTGSISASQSIICNGVNTGTGSVTNLVGGSGSQTYFWNNGASTSSATAPNNLSAGNWSVTVTDALTACQVYSVFTITQPSAITLNIAANSTSACAGFSINLTGTNSGGTPGYTYTWTAGPSTNTRIVSQSTAGAAVYTLNSRDANLCLTTKTISVNFVPNPTLTVSDVSICPLQMGTLSVGGASSYTWNASSSVGSTFTASPVGSTQYAVVGSAIGCTAAATASIIVKPVPSPTISNISPICNGQTLLLSASGGTSYLWSGPLSFVSSAQNPTISAAAPNRSGVYNLTVTAANACTAPASTTVLVNATPTISMSGGQVCLNSNLNLSANSFTGSTYFWSGPNSFTSSFQNPTISAVSFSAAGNYSLLVNSAASCTNTSSVGVTVNPLPTITISPTSSVICFGKSSTLTASGGATYLWSTGSNATVFAVSPTVTTSYTVLGISALGCTSTAVKNISVNVLPSVSVVVNPTVYCAGKSATLTASGANTYTWSASTTLSGTTIYSSSVIVNPAFTTFYNVKGTSAVTGCSNTAFATVSVNPLPSLTVTATKTIICAGTSASITASGANTYTWLPGNLTGANISPSPTVNTTYTVRGTITVSGCTNTALRTITVNKTPTVSMVSNTPSLCVGWSAVITPSGASTYTLEPGNITGNSFTVTPTSTTQYSLSGTNSVNCVNLIPSNANIIVHNLKAIQGVVTSTTGQTNGNVVLYAYKPVLGKWDSLNTSLVILNNYNFPSVPSGSYVVKSFPFPTDLVETYGLNASSWKGANVINHGCIANSVQNINVITFNNTIKSKATLSGKISQGAGYTQPGSPGSGIPNITVKAGIHPGPVIYQTTKTNALGQYTLANMAPNVLGQNYYILVDIPALDTNKTYHRIIITGYENFTNLDFVVDSQRIHPLNLKVGVKELSMLNSTIKVYPNPASDQISVELDLQKTEEVSIELFDLNGRKVKTLISLSQQDKGKLTVLAKVEEIKEGVYLIKIKIGNEEGTLKINLLR